MIRRLVGALTAALLVGGCTSDDNPWNELGSNETVLDGSVEWESDDVRLVLAEPYDVPCWQLQIGPRASWCPEITGGSSIAGYRHDGRQVIVAIAGWPGVSFRVWSSRDPGGRDVPAVQGPASDALVWMLEPDEEPWGVQIVDEAGFLIRAESLLDFD